MTKKPDPIKREVLSTARKSNDVEVHVSRVTFMGHTVVEVREFITSTKAYGRGLTVPPELVPLLQQGLHEALQA